MTTLGEDDVEQVVAFPSVHFPAVARARAAVERSKEELTGVVRHRLAERSLVPGSVRGQRPGQRDRSCWPVLDGLVAADWVSSWPAAVIDLRPHKRLPLDQRQDLGRWLAGRYRQGPSMATLAQELGTSVERVRPLLLDQGVRLRDPGGSRPGLLRPGWQQLAESVAREYAQGVSLVELGRRRAISTSSARRLVLAGGGRLRPRGARERVVQR